jgi:hypothetical protein
MSDGTFILLLIVFWITWLPGCSFGYFRGLRDGRRDAEAHTRSDGPDAA